MIVAFDLEIAKVIPDTKKLRARWLLKKSKGASKEELAEIEALGHKSKNLDNFSPLGISCAYTAVFDRHEGKFVGGRPWYERDVRDEIKTEMTPEALSFMFDFLYDNRDDIVTWNGLSFDLRTLYEEGAGLIELSKMRELAFAHTDMMFHCVCANGWALGLDKACKGMGLQGKTEGMDRAKAPVLWRAGAAEQQKVLDYVAQDAKITGELYFAVKQARKLNWISNNDKPCTWELERPLSVQDALALPLPDTSWMTNPKPREDYYNWLEA